MSTAVRSRAPLPAAAASRRPVALVLSFSDAARDPRVNRQIRFLAPTYRVVFAGFGPPDVEGVEFVRVAWAGAAAPSAAGRPRFRRLLATLARVRNIPRRLARYGRVLGGRVGPAAQRARYYEGVYWSSTLVHDCLRKLAAVQPDVVLTNDLETLPLALRVAGSAAVVFDAHEYSPREYDNSLRFRLFEQPYREYLARTYIPRAAAMTTIGDGIALEYERLTGVRATVVTNAPDYDPTLTPASVAAPDAPIRLVHHGIAVPVRKIELMIRTMELLDRRFELNLLFGSAEPRYLEYLQRLASRLPNVHFLPAVPMRQLPRFLNQFDVGVIMVAPVNLNYLHGLGNKFFEFIQARLAMAIGPLHEMARIVRAYDLGVVADDFKPESLARRLRALDRAAIDHYKWRAHACSRELSAERNAEVVRGIVAGVIGRGGADLRATS